MLLLKSVLFLIGLIMHEILASFIPLFCFCAGVFISSLF
ncbi:putative membrane protein [Helicobacter pylori Hp H-3]|nr:putative membrane protein [Helicobacter pylori Hp H-3]